MSTETPHEAGPAGPPATSGDTGAASAPARAVREIEEETVRLEQTMDRAREAVRRAQDADSMSTPGTEYAVSEAEPHPKGTGQETTGLPEGAREPADAAEHGAAARGTAARDAGESGSGSGTGGGSGDQSDEDDASGRAAGA
jgi:hypothetical protein